MNTKAKCKEEEEEEEGEEEEEEGEEEVTQLSVITKENASRAQAPLGPIPQYFHSM